MSSSDAPKPLIDLPPHDWKVTKRDGRTAPWDEARIARAAAGALASLRHSKGFRHLVNFGLPQEEWDLAHAVAANVTRLLAPAMREGTAPSVEVIQDQVERELAARGHFEAARAFIIYRADRARLRPVRHDVNGLSDYIAAAKYARFSPEKGRREIWKETVQRVKEMHLRRFARVDQQLKLPGMAEGSFSVQIEEAFAAVEARRILPSMRSLQFGGRAIEQEEARMFNCAFTFVNRVEAFRETLWLLLCGCGAGFSVQRQHIDMLPEFPTRGQEDELPVIHHSVADTIRGWADALDALVRSYLTGHLVEFNYSQIRSRGIELKTSGGRAPGHVPLRRSLERIRGILNQIPGRRIKPIEAYDILMHAARAVLSGGIRRSATICLFSADDQEMMLAKTGNWFDVNPQRSASNNSAVINRHTTPKQVYLDLFEKQKEFGEPGFYFVENEDYGANPCVEIGLAPFADIKDEAEIARLRSLGYEGPLAIGQRIYGWQMCNLCTINAAACSTSEEFYDACRKAAFIGTLQASYTVMPYLGPTTRFINERESLLGVSITGILDNPGLMLNPAVLEQGAQAVREENARVAGLIGIPAAARTTCVKPEGTASLLLGTSSGIHPHHAKRFFRRVQANRQEPVYRFFKSINPQLTEQSVYNSADDVITFPIQARPGAITRESLGALEFLEHVNLVQRAWVMAGRAYESYNPGLHHNVSNTCVVRPEEWEGVAEFIWEHRDSFTGVSLLPHTGDKIYAQAPNEAVGTEADIAKWNALSVNPVDYAQMREKEDRTSLREIVACAGGACEQV